MSKYVKLDDVIRLLTTEYYTNALAEGYDVQEDDYKDLAIENTKYISTTDIVRCGQCKYRELSLLVPNVYYCSNSHYSGEFLVHSREFCSRGKRRDNE